MVLLNSNIKLPSDFIIYFNSYSLYLLGHIKV
uniref:Uncharacterized protein n=1 Tax=Anguilla anguilla TaxID=7936 RepID=A0A0E9P8B1_ANGAN